MVELSVLTPAAHVPARTIGQVTLEQVDLGVLTSIAPYNGETGAVSKALKAAHGAAFPAPGRCNPAKGGQVLWFGREMALLLGPTPDAALAKHAALTDQSDAWVSLRLSGQGAEDVLARLAPIDLRANAFPEGHTARSLLGHMNASITRSDAEGFLLLVFRSMTDTLLHELETAMENVAARG